MQHPTTINPHVGVLLWRFEEGYSKEDDEVKETFAWFKEFLEDFTGYEHHFYYDHDHPNIVVHVGVWESIEQHFDELHKSEDFVEILQAFGGLVDVRASYHANISREGLAKVTSGDVLCLNRIWVSDENEKILSEKHEGKWLSEAVEATGGSVISGWRITEGGWSEKDAIDYFEGETVAPEAKRTEGTGNEEDLQNLNELITFIGAENIQSEAEVASRLPGNDDFKHLAERIYTRRFTRMDLTVSDEAANGVDDHDDDEDD